jgi:hypothetical protein
MPTILEPLCRLLIEQIVSAKNPFNYGNCSSPQYLLRCPRGEEYSQVREERHRGGGYPTLDHLGVCLPGITYEMVRMQLGTSHNRMEWSINRQTIIKQYNYNYHQAMSVAISKLARWFGRPSPHVLTFGAVSRPTPPRLTNRDLKIY